MNIHEYQAKEILERYGIPIPSYAVVSSLEEVQEAIKKFSLKEAILKIQVHAGGRGKGGGVKWAKSPEEILKTAKQLLKMRFVNNQTGSSGLPVHKLLISPPLPIQKEFYLGATIDRCLATGLLIASAEGGMDIEEIAKTKPDKILYLPISLEGEIRNFHLWRLANFMGWDSPELKNQGMQITASLARAFVETDASLLEINPLVETREKKLYAVDAKLTIDDNSLYRQKEIAALYDPTQYLLSEVDAKQHDLSYIALEGNIGCMVNGAGLAMGTMDLIHRWGGKPANFLDVGGSASKEKIAAGFRIILEDPNVKTILVNIFGGIMNCAVLAEGIIAAMKQLSLTLPIIVRMEGTEMEKGKELLKQSKLSVIIVDHLDQAAQTAVAKANACQS
jgi:succinyl-CoA synthetase beta subunit